MDKKVNNFDEKNKNTSQGSIFGGEYGTKLELIMP
jgi:hypothetical protein